MILQNKKFLISIFILLAYIGVGIFGLFEFNHMFETSIVNCPYTQNGSSICENILDHINDWHQFSNITFSTFFIFSFLILGIILYFFNEQNSSNQKRYFYRWKYPLDNKKLYTFQQGIINWLSLLENSPSFS
ncbi:hypothetical protein COW91_01705 [Candidatus Nomurabacteria bacterium CG22_combo_CG10-13_8_21_14_all_32_8]|uniref:Uncharacterized protein n=1 Tax=Candidatus Nomurabacteria bacterium CG22_combo_CG10-13_8_21_14_all_32_8 TaxID=1974732 RepID=A0A2H0CGJ2_9BACT|nr:MAG: hypothetical protein COW91_01705 [Candidatus Nomurabacteria bacterium CG22_combo_CG10-13_8_21_14_all_32_8]